MKSSVFRLVVGVLGVVSVACPVRADHVLWNVPGSGDWNLGTNWSAGVPDPADTAEIGQGVGNGGSAILSSAAPNILNLRLGESAGETGRLEVQPGGSLTTTSGDLLIAPGGATSVGTIDMTGGDLTVNNGRLELGQNGTGTITQSGGTFTVNNSHVVMGRGASAVSTINISDGTLQTAGSGNVRFHMAWDNADSKAYLNISGTGEVLTNVDDISGATGFLAAEQGTAEITVSDSGRLIVNGRGDSEGAMDLSRRGNSMATLTQTGGTVEVNNGYLMLGRWNNSTGIYDISGGTLTTGGSAGDHSIYLGWYDAGTTGELNVSGTGQVSTTGGRLYVSGNGTGTVTQTGGSVTTNDNFVMIGKNNGSVGTYTISGGTLQTAGTTGDRNIYLGWDQAGSQGTLNVSGSALVTPYDHLQIGGQGTGTVNQTGGTVTLDDRYVIIGRYGTSTGEYNISDGILQTTGTGTKSGANRRIHLGWDSADTKGTLNVSGNGQVIVNRDRVNGATGLLVGNYGTGEVNVSDNGSITVYGGGDGEGGMSLGLNGNSSGTVNQTGGSVTVYDNYLMIGRRTTATGTYNISGGTLETAGASGTTARIYMGWDSAGATGYLNLSGNGAVTTNKDNAADVNGGFYAGEHGNAYITIADNASLTINAGSDGEGMSLGRRDNAYVHVTQTGGTVTINDQYFIMGRYNSSEGVYDMSGGILQTAGTNPGDNRRFHLAWDSADTRATMNLSGTAQVIANADNTSTYGGFFVANQGTAELNISDNASLTVYAANESEGAMTVGRETNGVGTVNQSGGSVTLNDKYLMIGRYGNAHGTYNISGGTLTTTGSGDINTYLGWDGSGARGDLNVSGTADVQIGGDLQVGYNGTGVVTQAGGQVTVAGQTLLGRNTGSGTLNLNGGVFTTSALNQGAGSAEVNFDTGTLRAGTSFTTSLPMTLHAGGGTFDTNGNTLALTGQLDGAGGLTKTGDGTLVLGESNTFAGPLTINQGTVQLGLLASSSIWLDAADTASITMDGSNRVSNWQDSAGKPTGVSQGNTANQPTYVAVGINGLPSIHFDTAGGADQLLNTENYASPVTVLSVSRLTGGANSRLITSTTNNWLLGYWGGGIDDAHFDGWVLNSATGADTDPHLYEAVIRGPGQNTDFYVYDGRNPGIVLLASNTGGTTGPNGLALGAWKPSLNEASNGDVAEVLLFGGVLSATQRQAVENYLRNKWFGESNPVPSFNYIPDAAPVDITASGAALDLNDIDETIGSLAGDPGSYVTLGSGTLTTGGNGQSTEFGGSISGSGNVIKEGIGTFILSGDNAYTGTTDVGGGTLLVNGAHTGGGAYSVADGATLGGNGTIGTADENVTVNPGGSLAPGGSIGTLTFDLGSGILDLSSIDAGALEFELGPTSASDKVVLTSGTLDVGPLEFDDFSFLPQSGFGLGVYTLFDANSPISGSIVTAAGHIGGVPASIWIDTAGHDILLGVVPEPSALALAVLGLLVPATFAFRRQRVP